MQFIYKERYLKRFDRCSRQEQALIVAADRQIRSYYTTRQAPHGLGLKRLYANPQAKLFEARVSRATRIIWAESAGVVSFVLVGSHNEVQQHLRSLR